MESSEYAFLWAPGSVWCLCRVDDSDGYTVVNPRTGGVLLIEVGDLEIEIVEAMLARDVHIFSSTDEFLDEVNKQRDLGAEYRARDY